MPVISPRRSSSSASGNIYGTSTSSSVSGVSSASDTNSRTSLSDRSSSGYKSYLDRAGSLTKLTSSSSSYSPSSYLGSSSYSSYSPRSYSTYRSAGSSLTGGASGVGTYRSTFSSLGSSAAGSNSYDSTTLSRYGVNRRNSKTSASDILLKKDPRDKAVTKKPPSGSDASGGGSGSSFRDSKRLSGSCSSSSLAMLVATSGLDLYEKYSPTHYKPNTQLDSGSRSALNEAGTDLDERRTTAGVGDTTTANISLERPRISRFSRINSRNDSDETDNIASATLTRRSLSGTRTSGRLSASNSNSNLNAADSTEDVPTATFTLRSNRLRKSKIANDEDKKPLRNGLIDGETKKKYTTEPSVITTSTITSNGIDTVAYVKLNKLQISEPKVDPDDNSTTQSSSSYITKSGSSSKLKTSSSHDSIATDLLDVNSSSSYSSSRNKTDENNDLENNDMNKVRSSAALRSVLPPASPTSSRYYDRDSSRSALISSSTSHNSTDENKKSTASDEDSEGLCGLRNIGNTCFMNSIIQCLSHTNELTKFLRNYAATKSPTSKDQQILYEFSKLIKEMWTNSVHSVTPLELKRSFSAKHRMYSDYNQQDAQEFLRFFLDSLHGALNSGTKGEHLKIDDNLSDNKKAELTWDWYTRHENSLIRDLFVGQLKSTLRCTTCGNASVTFDPFWDLSVPLPSSSRCKLDACLDLFIREEVLDGDEMPTCAKCQTRRKCTKSFTIQRFPKYLVIHLKRFSETRWSKLSNIVEFPTGERELNMGPYGANTNSNIYYSLYAISNHMGSTAGGHYVAICKHPVTKKWHEFNDNLVSDSLSEHHLVSSSAYILFYERA